VNGRDFRDSAAQQQVASDPDAMRRDVLQMDDLNRSLSLDERWFSTALKSIGDAVIATDDRSRVLYMNPVAEALTGWSGAAAHGKPLAEVFQTVNEATGKPGEDPVAKVLATGQCVGRANRTVLIARDGKYLPIDESAAPVVDDQGHATGIILVFRDVTEKTQAALMTERLAAIIESSDDIIASKTLDGVLTSWNRGAERILGYTAEEVIGRHVSMLMPPELVEDMPRILDRIRRGEKVDHYQTRRRRKDGRIIDVSLTVSPIRDASGRIIGASKIGRDITQEKVIEVERLEADRRKDEFLAMLAHELRNPLSAINSAAQLLGKLEAEKELEWANEVIVRQVKHLARLIDDLLDVSRISRGKIQLRKEPIDLAPVVHSAVDAVRPLLEERKHELSVTLIDRELLLEADPLRVEQILINLLTNAAKYTDSGGRIWLTARREGAEIVVTVRDTGIGITPELMPRVFDLFTQGDRTIARSEGGLGIGLTLVRKLAEMHGGTVTAESEGSGKGSAFTVRFPALEKPRPSAPSRGGTLLRAGRLNSRVLVVDDNVDNARGLSRLLTLLGHDVRAAHDGEAAIEAARAHRPEIVVLDIGLPGMDGYEVARRLRTEACCQDALIIAASGYGQPDDLRRSREAGFDHHLVKPIDYDALMVLFAPRSR
jgi:PAS domain S-box-containing protein